MCEAGITLADGHRFVVAARGPEGVPALDVHLPTGAQEHLVLDEALGTSVHALPLELDGGEESDVFGVRSQLFVRAFASNEEALQDPTIANYLALGDLDLLDLEATRITARVVLTTWAFEVTLVAVEDQDEASLVLLSHRRVFASGSDADTTSAVFGGAHGILAAIPATEHAGLSLDAFEVEGDSVLATAFAGSLFEPHHGHDE